MPSFAIDSLIFDARVPFSLNGGWAGAGTIRDGVRSRALIDVLSPDSTKSLDFDMYLDFGHGSADLERDVDSAPILADFKRDSTYQLAFCGPACSYDGAYWADKDRCALTGVTASGEQLLGPACAFLEVYDFRSSMRGRWLGPAVDERGFRAWQAASDSALAARIARAWDAVGIDTSTSSRIDLRSP